MLQEHDQTADVGTAAERTEPPGEHPSVERLVSALEAYDAASVDAEQVYQRLIRPDGDPTLLAMLELALDEHRRHRQTIKRLADLVQHVVNDELTPHSGVEDWFPSKSAAEALRFLIREERASAQHLRHLARQEPRMAEGLFATTLEVMARDDDKHEHVLRYLLRRLELDDRIHVA